MTLPLALRQPNSDYTLIDCDCPQKSGDWAEKQGASVVRIHGDFNVALARNKGVSHISGGWICFLDVDVMVSFDFVARILPLLRYGAYYRCARQGPGYYGTFLCSYFDFHNIGGYDPNFRGYGVEDTDVFKRLELSGLLKLRYPANLIKHIDHGNALRTKSYDVDFELSQIINKTYFKKKMFLMRKKNRFLTQVELREIYNHAKIFCINRST
jgi:glycosyltransferase involved in cell wall biosynthesis